MGEEEIVDPQASQIGGIDDVVLQELHEHGVRRGQVRPCARGDRARLGFDHRRIIDANALAPSRPVGIGSP